MSRLDYRGVLDRAPRADSEPESFVLHLGRFELEPISYSVLVTLSDCPEAIQRALQACFLERPVLWADLTGESPRHCSESLKDLYGLLRAVDERLLVQGNPNEGFYSTIIERWLDLTRDVVGDLRKMLDAGKSDTLRRRIAEYRRHAGACVEALAQFLPDTDPLVVQVREKLEHGDPSRMWSLGSDAQSVESTHWTVVALTSALEDSGFVTWGVP